MPFLFIAPARFSPSPTGEREPSDAVFIHCSGPLLSLSHWREGTVRCRFYSMLRPAFLTLPLERGNRSMPFLFNAPARFSHSPTGEREPSDTVFLPLPLERGNRSMPFLFTAPARFSPSPTGEREPFDAVLFTAPARFSPSPLGRGSG